METIRTIEDIDDFLRVDRYIPTAPIHTLHKTQKVHAEMLRKTVKYVSRHACMHDHMLTRYKHNQSCIDTSCHALLQHTATFLKKEITNCTAAYCMRAGAYTGGNLDLMASTRPPSIWNALASTSVGTAGDAPKSVSATACVPGSWLSKAEMTAAGVCCHCSSGSERGRRG